MNRLVETREVETRSGPFTVRRYNEAAAVYIYKELPSLKGVLSLDWCSSQIGAIVQNQINHLSSSNVSTMQREKALKKNSWMSEEHYKMYCDWLDNNRLRVFAVYLYTQSLSDALANEIFILKHAEVNFKLSLVPAYVNMNPMNPTLEIGSRDIMTTAFTDCIACQKICVIPEDGQNVYCETINVDVDMCADCSQFAL